MGLLPSRYMDNARGFRFREEQNCVLYDCISKVYVDRRNYNTSENTIFSIVSLLNGSSVDVKIIVKTLQYSLNSLMKEQ